MTDTFKLQQEAEARVHAAAEERRRLVGRIPPGETPLPRPVARPERAAFDGDQMMILLLALLLMQNGVSDELLLALLYIAL